jgi:3-(3-hydroxy-phenyl)propionate hydroxylase
LPDSVLDTYQSERKPHAQALIRLAKLIGRAMTEGGDVGNFLRRVLAPTLRRVPSLSRQILSSATPPLRRTDLVVRPRVRRTLAGGLCPNALLDDGRRFDDVAAGRFAVVTSVPPSPAQHAAIESRGALVLTARAGTDLHRWLRRNGATAALVRPDGTVLRAERHLSAVCAALPAFGTSRAQMTGTNAPRPGHEP